MAQLHWLLLLLLQTMQLVDTLLGYWRLQVLWGRYSRAFESAFKHQIIECTRAARPSNFITAKSPNSSNKRSRFLNRPRSWSARHSQLVSSLRYYPLRNAYGYWDFVRYTHNEV